MLKKACKMVYIGKKSQIMRIIYKHVLIKKTKKNNYDTKYSLGDGAGLSSQHAGD